MFYLCVLSVIKIFDLFTPSKGIYLKTLLSIAIIIISSAAFAKTPVSEYKVRLFKDTASREKLWCQFCDKYDRQISTRARSSNTPKTDSSLTVKVHGQKMKVEVTTFYLSVVGEEKAKELGFDGSATPSFVIVKDKKVVLRNTSINGNNLSKLVQESLNEITPAPVKSERKKIHIPTVWELKATGQFNY